MAGRRRPMPRYQISYQHLKTMTSALSSYRKQSSVDAKAILNSGVPTLDALTSALAAMPFVGHDALSTAESSFVATLLGGDVEQPNKVVDDAYVSVRNALAMGAEHTRVLERFVGLHVPQMGEFCLCRVVVVAIAAGFVAVAALRNIPWITVYYTFWSNSNTPKLILPYCVLYVFTNMHRWPTQHRNTEVRYINTILYRSSHIIISSRHISYSLTILASKSSSCP